MAINYPVSLDNFTNPTPSDDLDTTAVLHSTQHANHNDAIEALMAKLGVNNSSVTSSIDYRLRDIESVAPYNVANLSGAVGDGVTNDWQAFKDAIDSGASWIVIPTPSASYYISGAALTLGDGQMFIGKGNRPEIKHDPALNTNMFSFSGVAGAGMQNLTLNGNYSATNATAIIYVVSGCSDLNFSDLTLKNAKGFSFYTNDMSRSSLRRIRTEGGQNSGLEITGANTMFNNFEDIEADGNVGMGIRNDNGAHHNYYVDIKTNGNDLEGFAFTYSTHDNRAVGISSTNCGDNGISLSGYNNKLACFDCSYNYHNGLGFYGNRNVISAGEVYNNNQRILVEPSITYAGIDLSSGFGGLASYNTITGIMAYDNQAVPTQKYGISISATNYSAFNNGTTYPIRSFVTNASKIYVNTSGTVASGGGAPTHTSGTTGGWTYLDITTTTYNPTGNKISTINGYGNISGLYKDTQTLGTNYLAEQVMGSMFVTTPADQSYTLVAAAPYAGMINSIKGLATASGTLTGAVKINGTNVTSLSGLSVTSTPQSVTATGANTFAKGDRITFVVSSNSSGASLEASLEILRLT